MRPAQLLAAVVAMSSVSHAISDAFDNIHGMSEVKAVLLGRQDNSEPSASSQAPKSSAQPEATDKPTRTQSSGNKDEASQTEKPSGTQKASGSGSKVTGKPKATSFDPRLPAGGVTMVTPNALAGDQFYKVGNYITFAWNYTSLSVTPSAIDVMASCSANQATYTIAVNISAQETKVIWDTKNTPSGQAPFLTEKYTLLIYDADASVTQAPRAGYLGVFNAFSFGMYTPQPYTPYSEYECATCAKNGGFTNAEKLTMKVMFITSGTTIASMIYFAHNFGLF